MDIDERFRNKIMNDIMIRLRTMDYVLSAQENIEAADEIERLRKRVAELENKSGKLIIAPPRIHGRYPLDGMEIGDGFNVPIKEKYNIRNILKRHKNKFTTRIIDDRIYVWRVQ